MAAGVSEAEIERIAAPIGLDIGASSPAEIAVAVMAQIIAALPPARPCRAPQLARRLALGQP